MPKKKRKKTQIKLVKKTKKKILKQNKIDIDQILLNSRQVFLHGAVTEELAFEVNKKLIALNNISNSPIILWINSGGGSIYSGFSIIDTLSTLEAPIITLINGIAASMAGIISVCGHTRIMTANSTWMGHDGRGGSYDYFEKIYDRVDFYKKLQSKIFKIYRNYTKLNERDLVKIRNGELWLFSEECKKKEIIDVILKKEIKK